MKNHKSASPHFSQDFLGTAGHGQVAQAFSLCGFSFSAVRDGAQTEVCASRAAAQYPGGSTVTIWPLGNVTFTGLRLLIPLMMGSPFFSGCPYIVIGSPGLNVLWVHPTPLAITFGG